ncbi:hypothetical protein D6833_08330, partial [Candidatus Parcubacteria bacterium]
MQGGLATAPTRGPRQLFSVSHLLTRVEDRRGNPVWQDPDGGQYGGAIRFRCSLGLALVVL